MSGLQRLAALGQMVPQYVNLRAQHPLVPARRVVEYIKHDDGVPFEQFICSHDWVEGEPDRCDEGPIRCALCGADGDA